MPSPTFESTVRRRLARLDRSLGEELRRLREDAGLSIAAVARAAGVNDSFLGKVEDARERASAETLIRVGLVLGADLSAHLYPNAGPAIRDRLSAPMLELLLRERHPRWDPYTEVSVHRPSRGWIDAVLHEPRARLAVAAELQSELRRLEQLVRWQAAKADSLPSWDRWPHLGGPPEISRLLLVRRSRTTRAVAGEFAAQLRVAYPAHPDDAVAALVGSAQWPGPALVWTVVEGGVARFVGGR